MEDGRMPAAEIADVWAYQSLPGTIRPDSVKVSYYSPHRCRISAPDVLLEEVDSSKVA
jgi:hypothetical protein